jgi:hypothetical protein
MKNALSSFALLLLVSVAVHAQQLVAHASYQGPGNSFPNAILVPAGDDKLVTYGGSPNQLLCYNASLESLWKSEALRKKEQFVGDPTVHHDTIAAFAIKLEAGTKTEIIALQRYSLATGQLINEQKVCALPKDRPKGFPVSKLSPDRNSVYFITYATTGEGTSVTYTRYAFSTNETATGTFEIPAKSSKLLEPVVSDEQVVFVASLSDAEAGIYVHKAGLDRVIARTLELPDHKHLETRLFATGGAAYVVVHAQDKDHVTQDLHIAKVDLADGSLQKSKNLPLSGKKEFLYQGVRGAQGYPGRIHLPLRQRPIFHYRRNPAALAPGQNREEPGDDCLWSGRSRLFPRQPAGRQLRARLLQLHQRIIFPRKTGHDGQGDHHQNSRPARQRKLQPAARLRVPER